MSFLLNPFAYDTGGGVIEVTISGIESAIFLQANDYGRISGIESAIFVQASDTLVTAIEGCVICVPA